MRAFANLFLHKDPPKGSLTNLALTELPLEIRNICREIGEKYIHPRPGKVRRGGLVRPFHTEEFGGMGGSTKDMMIPVEEPCKYDADIAFALFGTALGTLPILLCATQGQKAKYLPRIAEGTIAAFVLPEANEGSGAAESLVRAHGPKILLNAAKAHFRTTDQVLAATGHTRLELPPKDKLFPSRLKGRNNGRRRRSFILSTINCEAMC